MSKRCETFHTWWEQRKENRKVQPYPADDGGTEESLTLWLLPICQAWFASLPSFLFLICHPSHFFAAAVVYKVFSFPVQLNQVDWNCKKRCLPLFSAPTFWHRKVTDITTMNHGKLRCNIFLPTTASLHALSCPQPLPQHLASPPWVSPSLTLTLVGVGFSLPPQQTRTSLMSWISSSMGRSMPEGVQHGYLPDGQGWTRGGATSWGGAGS